MQCSICSKELADSPLAGPAHARTHRNDFERLVGRRPRDYDEVRELYNEGKVPDDADLPAGAVGKPTTLDRWRDDRAGGSD